MTLDVDRIEFTATLDGTGLGDGDEWKDEANRWTIVIGYAGRKFSTPYWCGPGLATYRPGGHHRDPKRLKPHEGFKYNHYGPGKDAITTPRPPERDEVLHSLAGDCQLGDQSFSDFCADLGYDEDSRKAYASWEACREMMYELRELFGADFRDFIEHEWED